jgi:hypothetical protein
MFAGRRMGGASEIIVMSTGSHSFISFPLNVLGLGCDQPDFSGCIEYRREWTFVHVSPPL